MTSRERIVNTMAFKPVDRIPLVEWGIRESTMHAFIAQGYPESADQVAYFGLDPMTVGVPVRPGMYPLFEEKTLWQNDEYKIWIDELGAKRKDFLINATPGFVTRSWLEFPVKNLADFEKVKWRFDPYLAERIPENWKARAQALNAGTTAVHLAIPFLFWVARDLIGFEGLCMAFYDEEELIEAVFEHLTDFTIALLDRFIRDIKIDFLEFKEDMAYKHAPMISPAMFNKFMRKHYRRIIGYAKSHSVGNVFVDCDGFPGGLIPCWLDVGVDAMSPCEIAAGNDLLVLRREYPTFGLLGGIDKRELAKTRKHILAEVISKVPAMIEKGGYVPHVDHAIPPDISLSNYLYFREVMQCVANGVTPPQP